ALDLSIATRHPGIMERRRLGTDGLTTSAIGLGCMGFSQGYGPADDAESLRAIDRALDAGVTLLDTAMSYGQGHNERLLARALATHRDRVELATKFGIVRGENGVRLDGRPEHVREYCDASLSRLGTDVIDLYYLHRADPQVPVAESVGAMAELVKEGKVRHLGLSEVTAQQLEEDVVPTARRLGIGLVPYSPLGRGLLTATLGRDQIDSSDFRRSDPRFHGADLERNLAQIEALRAIAAEWGATPGQLALAWLLAQGSD